MTDQQFYAALRRAMRDVAEETLARVSPPGALAAGVAAAPDREKVVAYHFEVDNHDGDGYQTSVHLYKPLDGCDNVRNVRPLIFGGIINCSVCHDEGGIEKAISSTHYECVPCNSCSKNKQRRDPSAGVAAAPAESAQSPTRLDPVVEANRALLHQRSQLGIKKYGVTLDEARLPEREILQHALEEALDLSNYLQARIQECDRISIDAAMSAPEQGEKGGDHE